MRKREKKNLAILLSVAMLFSMNVSTVAQEMTEDAAAQGSLDGYGTLEEAGVTGLTTEIEGGWSYNITSPASAEITVSDGKCLIRPNYSVKRERDAEKKELYRSGYGIDICFNGSMDSEDLYIKTVSHCILGKITNRSIDEFGKEIVTESRNSITINISSNELMASGSKELKIYVQELGESVSAGQAGDSEGYKYTVSGTLILCKFKLSPGLRAAKYYTENGKEEVTYNEKVKIDGVEYSVYTIRTAMDMNAPFNFVKKQVGNCVVGYYTNIPFFGKKIKKRKEDEVLGNVVVRDKDGNTYEVVKANVVRMKNPPSGQGAFPTLSNAGLQITKVRFVSSSGNALNDKDKKKAAKEVSKALKQATKVNKKAPADSYQLPLLIYPYRLFGEGLEANLQRVSLNKKRNQVTLEYFFGNKKYKIKDGKKDSFKTGTHSVQYSEPYLTVSSADVWTGPKGLSNNIIKK